MADLIDRATLAEEIESLTVTVAGKPARWYDAKHSVLRVIAEQPTIDPESLRPKGEWIDIYNGKYANPLYVCSCCSEKALYKAKVDELGHEQITQALSLSCPNCGADLRGEA